MYAPGEIVAGQVTMAADDLNIYWADGSYGAAMKWPLAGGTQDPAAL